MMTHPLHAQQSQLSAGDIVFLSANPGSVAPNPSNTATGNFAFAPLVNVAAGTVIHFSDQARTSTGAGFSGWRRNGAGEFNERPIYTWVAPTAISAGTRIIVQDTVLNGMNLGAAGDTILAFQGSVYKPSFISAVGVGQNSQFITSGTVSNQTDSYLPSPLVLGTNAVSVTSSNTNYEYDEVGTTTGTAATLRSSVNNSSNWTVNEIADQFGPASLTVTDAVAAPVATEQVGGYSFNTSGGLTPTVHLPNTTLSDFTFSGAGANTSATGLNSLVGSAFHVTGGWDTDALDTATQYFGFTVTVDSGYSFSLDDLGVSFDSDQNITVARYYSTDGFATSTRIGNDLSITDTNVLAAAETTDLNLNDLTGTVSFRFYGFNANSAGADLSLDEVWLQGNVATIPEPSAALLTSLGILLLLRRRKNV